MADLRRKYIYISAVAMVEMTFPWHSFFTFPFFDGIGKLRSDGYDKKVTEYTEYLRKIQPSKASSTLVM